MRTDFKNVKVQSSVLKKRKEGRAVFFSTDFLSGTTQITVVIPVIVRVL